MKKMINITRADYKRLKAMVLHERKKLEENLSHLDLFESIISNADIMDSQLIPSNYVTMGTKIKIFDMETGKTRLAEVTYPHDSASRNDKISVLSELGRAVFGHSKGTMVYYNSSLGKKKIRIDEIIFQPEAYGIYDDAFIG